MTVSVVSVDGCCMLCLLDFCLSWYSRLDGSGTKNSSSQLLEFPVSFLPFTLRLLRPEAACSTRSDGTMKS